MAQTRAGTPCPSFTRRHNEGDWARGAQAPSVAFLTPACESTTAVKSKPWPPPSRSPPAAASPPSRRSLSGPPAHVFPEHTSIKGASGFGNDLLRVPSNPARPLPGLPAGGPAAPSLSLPATRVSGTAPAPPSAVPRELGPDPALPEPERLSHPQPPRTTRHPRCPRARSPTEVPLLLLPSPSASSRLVPDAPPHLLTTSPRVMQNPGPRPVLRGAPTSRPTAHPRETTPPAPRPTAHPAESRAGGAARVLSGDKRAEPLHPASPSPRLRPGPSF